MPDPGRRPTLLFFYGNGMCLNDAVDLFDQFRRLGVNVLIPDYEGYGMSSGTAGERALYGTADAAYMYLMGRRDLDPEKIVASGWLLGGAVAVDLASRRHVAGLVTFCTFTSMADMARQQFPYLRIPTFLLRCRFENEAKIRRVSCPVLIGHGRRDALVPFSMSDRLAAAAGGPVTRIIISNAGHEDFFSDRDEEVFKPLGRFLNGLFPSPPEAPKL